MIDCEIEHLSTNKIFKLGMPTRRKGKFKLKKHEELGYQDGYWKDWSSRENQLRYYRFKDSEDSLHKEDGLNKILEVLDVDNVDDTLYPNTKFINVKMK